jgi:hypothetical protein
MSAMEELSPLDLMLSPESDLGPSPVGNGSVPRGTRRGATLRDGFERWRRLPAGSMPMRGCTHADAVALTRTSSAGEGLAAAACLAWERTYGAPARPPVRRQKNCAAQPAV